MKRFSSQTMKRLGIAAVSGLLVVGLTPSLVGFANADPASGSGTATARGTGATPSGFGTPSSTAAVTINGAKVSVSGSATNTAVGDASEFNKLYEVEVASANSNADACAKLESNGSPVDSFKYGYAAGAPGGNPNQWELNAPSMLTFKPQNTPGTGGGIVCTYTLKQTPADGKTDEDVTGWTASQDVYTLKLKAVTSTGASSNTVTVTKESLQVSQGGTGTPQNTDAIHFENRFQGSWMVTYYKSNGDRLSTESVQDRGKLAQIPTTGMCENENTTVFSHWQKGSPSPTDVSNMGEETITANTVYTAKCVPPAVKFEGAKFSSGQDSTEVSINLGDNNKYDGATHADDTVTPPSFSPLDNSPKHFLGWETGTGSETVRYDKQLKDSNGRLYQPQHGDVLTAKWGHEVTYQNEEGRDLGSTIVEVPPRAGANPQVLADGSSLSQKQLCALPHVPTGKWFKVKVNGVTTSSPTAEVFPDIDADMTLKADCAEGVPMKFDANGGQFKSSAVKNVSHDTLSGSVLTRTYLADTSLVAPEGSDLQRPGFRFKGWAATNNATEAGTVPARVPADPQTYYAVWTAEPGSTPGGGSGSNPGGNPGGGSAGGSGGGSFGGGSFSTPTPTPTQPQDKKPGKKPQTTKKSGETKFDAQFKTPVKPAAVRRTAGSDRVATAVSAFTSAKNHSVAVLATGDNYPDALVGGALAGAYKGGVMLSTGDALEPSVLQALKAAGTKTVHIIGGYSAVSAQKEAQLRAAGIAVIRHAGVDRYDTARKIKAATRAALGLRGNAKAAVSCNATGANFPDALACASAAAQMGGTVELVRPGSRVATDNQAKTTICAGGTACAGADSGVKKVVGSDRYETAYQLAELTPNTGTVMVANGRSYADSLVAGALAPSLQAKLVLSDARRVNLPTGTKSAHLFGGKAALPEGLPMFTK